MGESVGRRLAPVEARTRTAELRGGLDAEASAWALAIPCALIAAAAAYLLGPALGELLRKPRSITTIWPYERSNFRPEPTEQARYLLLLLAPALLAAGVALGARRPLALSARAATAARRLVNVAVAGLVVASMLAQYRLHYDTQHELPRDRYFTPATLAAAGGIALIVLLAVRRDAIRRVASRALRESRMRRGAAVLVAVAMTATWLLHAINTDISLNWADHNVLINFPFTFDEAFAIVNGRTPLVDYVPLYSFLWPFVTAIPLLLVAKTALVFTITMCAISALALLAVFGVLRRATHSSVAALLLYLPFLATSLFRIRGTYALPHTSATYLQIFPLRYAGPLFLAWAVARHLDRGDGARWPLFALGGLVAINNLEFGGPALAATGAALIWTDGAPRLRTLARLGRDVAAGLAVALAAVAAVTLIRAGSLPHLGMVLEYPLLFASGLAMAPMPGVLGLHLIVYLTFGAALAVATARAVATEPNRVLTGMLAWSGIFGFGAASYFVGETGPIPMKASFGVWMLAMMLLVVVVVQRLAAQPRRLPSLAHVAVLLGFGVAACSLAQTLTPWSQIARLRMRPPEGASASGPYTPPPASQSPEVRDFFASVAYGRHAFYVKHGAPVAFLNLVGHRIADAYGVVDVSRYGHLILAPTQEMVLRVVRDLRRAGGNTLFLDMMDEGLYGLLTALGFVVLTEHGLRRYRKGVTPKTASGMVTKWVDTHNLHPRILRDGRGRRVEPDG